MARARGSSERVSYTSRAMMINERFSDAIRSRFAAALSPYVYINTDRKPPPTSALGAHTGTTQHTQDKQTNPCPGSAHHGRRRPPGNEPWTKNKQTYADDPDVSTQAARAWRLLWGENQSCEGRQLPLPKGGTPPERRACKTRLPAGRVIAGEGRGAENKPIARAACRRRRRPAPARMHIYGGGELTSPPSPPPGGSAAPHPESSRPAARSWRRCAWRGHT